MPRHYFGQAAARMRSIQSTGAQEVRKVFEASLAQRLGDSSVGPISISEESAPPRPVKVEMDFTAGKLGQLFAGPSPGAASRCSAVQ